jgi:hypothetical protein
LDGTVPVKAADRINFKQILTFNLVQAMVEQMKEMREQMRDMSAFIDNMRNEKDQKDE